MEKDLCLDVALRLGKSSNSGCGRGCGLTRARTTRLFHWKSDEHREPGQGRPVYFDSCEFKQGPRGRGIETYYLNLKGSAEAMEVAARENATAQGGVHELQDLVMKIARTEKIDESKELAEDIQDSLASGFKRAASR